jgi:hypothetical protein
MKKKWLMTLFILSILITSPQLSFAGEANPPVLSAISVDKSSVDVSESSQIITLTTSTSDESGIDWSASGSYLTLWGPTGTFQYILGDETTPNQFEIMFDSSMPSGRWLITTLGLKDNAGNVSTYGNGELVEFGLPEYFGVYGGAPSAFSLGCIDPRADNYDASATVDDASCTFSDPTVASFSREFGGFLVDVDTFTFPTGAEVWAGVANNNPGLYPISLEHGGTLTFTGSADADVNVFFNFQKNPYPDTEPSYTTGSVTVAAGSADYSIDLGSQGANTFSSLLMYIVERDAPVTITDIVLSTNADNVGSSTPNNQIIKVANTPKGILGKTVLLDIAYDTSDNNNQLTGLGMRVHFNSSLLSFKQITNLVEQDIIVNGLGPFNDVDDFDNDPLTDKFIYFGWASIFGNWPNIELPAILMNIAFDVSDAIDTETIAETSINFTSSEESLGYQFVSESYNLELQAASWDFDGNGQADALSDGLMMLRYCFGLRGENVTAIAMSPDSPMTSDEVIAEIETALAVADIDNDGEIRALTDGLMLLRYLFGLEGELITNQAVSPNANRTSNEEIQAYLEAYMPAM